MKPFMELVMSLLKLEFYGKLIVQFKGKEGIIHVEKQESLNTEPFKSGWNEPIPD